jgi:hypothetical protein
MKRVLPYSNTIPALSSKLSQKKLIYEISCLEAQLEDQLRTLAGCNGNVSAFVKWKESAPFRSSIPLYFNKAEKLLAG